jgi:CHAD domain-containing protein
MPASTEQARELLGRLAGQARATLKNPEAETVHDLRAAIRRFTQALTVFENSLGARELRKTRKQLKALMALAGGVRDCDIAMLLVSRKAEDGPALQSQLEARRKSGAKALAAGLRKWLARDPLPLADHAPGDLDRFAAAELPRALKRFFAKGRKAAHDSASNADMHQFRIRTKKLRYTLELFRPQLGETLDPRLEQLKSLQTLLGEVNDCHTSRRLLKVLKAGDAVLQSLKRRQARKTAAFRRAWKEGFDTRGIKREWKKAWIAAPQAASGGAG